MAFCQDADAFSGVRELNAVCIEKRVRCHTLTDEISQMKHESNVKGETLSSERGRDLYFYRLKTNQTSLMPNMVIGYLAVVIFYMGSNDTWDLRIFTKLLA